MRGLTAFLWSVRYTRPSQLLHRARRRLAELAPAVGALRLAPEGGLPGTAPDPPRASFAPPALVAEGGELRLPGVRAPLPPALRTADEWARAEGAAATRLGRFHLHYHEFLPGLDDGAFARAVDSWIDRHRPGGPGHRDAWSPYTLSVRTVVWMQELARRRVPAGFEQRARRSLVRQLRHLARHLELDLGGNHLLKNLRALLWASAFFRGREARRWGERARALLDRELDEQVLADGVHFERSPAYHGQVVADLLDCRAVTLRSASRGTPGPSVRLDDALSRMLRAQADLTHPDGLPSLFGDGGLRLAPSARESAEVARALGLAPPAPEERGTIQLASAGFYGLRAPGEVALVRAGAASPDHLPAHGHGDLLAFEWTVDGARFVVDAGVFEYEAGPARDWSRSTTAHNTVTVDDADQCEFWSSFRVARRARVRLEAVRATPDGLSVAAAHDGYARLAGAPLHRRALDLAPGRIGVEDRVQGGDGQPVRARLLLHPEVALACDGDGWLLARGAARVRLETAARVSVIEVPWCPDFDTCLPTRQLVLDYGVAPCAGGFTLRRVDGAPPAATASSTASISRASAERS